jgi:hypothetical protein
MILLTSSISGSSTRCDGPTIYTAEIKYVKLINIQPPEPFHWVVKLVPDLISHHAVDLSSSSQPSLD